MASFYSIIFFSFFLALDGGWLQWIEYDFKKKQNTTELVIIKLNTLSSTCALCVNLDFIFK